MEKGLAADLHSQTLSLVTTLAVFFILYLVLVIGYFLFESLNICFFSCVGIIDWKSVSPDVRKTYRVSLSSAGVMAVDTVVMERRGSSQLSIQTKSLLDSVLWTATTE